jgi:hypothetical protein
MDDYDVTTEEASTLGFAPGYWPAGFAYDGHLVYLQRFERDAAGDVQWADYGYDGGRLRVYND